MKSGETKWHPNASLSFLSHQGKIENVLMRPSRLSPTKIKNSAIFLTQNIGLQEKACLTQNIFMEIKVQLSKKLLHTKIIDLLHLSHLLDNYTWGNQVAIRTMTKFYKMSRLTKNLKY